MCAISIGFCINGVPTIGVVLAPFMGGEGESSIIRAFATLMDICQVLYILLSIIHVEVLGCPSSGRMDR